MDNGKIEPQQQALLYPVLPQLPEEEQSLLCFLADGGDVIFPCKFIADVYTIKEFKGVGEGYGMVRYCRWCFGCGF